MTNPKPQKPTPAAIAHHERECKRIFKRTPAGKAKAKPDSPTKPNPDKLYYSPTDAAEALGLSRSAAMKRIQNGTLPALRYKNRWFIDPDVLKDQPPNKRKGTDSNSR